MRVMLGPLFLWPLVGLSSSSFRTQSGLTRLGEEADLHRLTASVEGHWYSGEQLQHPANLLWVARTFQAEVGT